jgi:hypothetical protein
MTRFAVGDQVVIRYGKHQGHKATILETQEADVYKVKADDGFILYYSGKGLENERAAAAKAVSCSPPRHP